MAVLYECENNVKLRALSRSFFYSGDSATRYRQWMEDREVTRYNSHGLFPKGQKEIDAWLDEVENGHAAVTYAILYKNEWVGVCSLQSLNFINRSGEVAIYIGDRSAWGKGIATQAIGALMEHGFLRLGLNRIWSGTAETNTAMRRVFERLGFSLEGVFRQGMFLHGEFVHVASYSILEGEYHEKNTRG